MLATIRSRLHRAAQRGQVKRASAAYVVTDGIIRAAQGMRKQAQEPQNMPVPRAGNWRQYLPADPLLVATLQGKRLSGNTSRRVMDFGRKAWNTFQHMPVVGTKSPPTINDADVARLRYYQPPKSHPASPTGQLSTGTPYLNRPARNPVPPAATKSPSRLPNALQSFPQFSDVSPFPPTRVAARLNALALAPAVHKRWSQETSARDYVDWLTAQRQQK